VTNDDDKEKTREMSYNSEAMLAYDILVERVAA
jgi:hypothetical protein